MPVVAGEPPHARSRGPGVERFTELQPGGANPTGFQCSTVAQEAGNHLRLARVFCFLKSNSHSLGFKT